MLGWARREKIAIARIISRSTKRSMGNYFFPSPPWYPYEPIPKISSPRTGLASIAGCSSLVAEPCAARASNIMNVAVLQIPDRVRRRAVALGEAG
jgi:hypothetical protein